MGYSLAGIILLTATLMNVQVFGVVSTSNIATGGMLAILLLRKTIRFRSRDAPFLLAVTGLLGGTAIVGLLSSQAGGGLEPRTIKICVGWLLLIVPFLFGYMNAKVFLERRTAVLASITCILACLLPVALLSTSVFTASGQLRYAISQSLPGGINGYLFGLFILQAWPFSLLHREKGATRYKFLGYVAIIMPMLTNGLLGSRQYLVGIVLFIVLFFVFKAQSLFKGGLKATVAIIGLLGAVALLTFSIPELSKLAEERFWATEKQFYEGYDRTVNWSYLSHEVQWNSMLGEGVGHSQRIVGGAADHFYLEHMIDFGVPATLLMVITMTGVFICRRPRGQRVPTQLETSTSPWWLCALLSITWFAFFNEIVREPGLWLMVGIVVNSGIRGAPASLSSLGSDVEAL